MWMSLFCCKLRLSSAWVADNRGERRLTLVLVPRNSCFTLPSVTILSTILCAMIIVW